MSEPSLWQGVVSSGSALLLGAVGGGVVSAVVAGAMFRSDTAQRLMTEALRIQSSVEAWVLEGDPSEAATLSQNRGLGTTPRDGLWLRAVELRVVLDEASWNAPEEPFYGFIAGHRTWIVRDKIVGPRAYPGALKVGWQAAVVSSRGLEELCGWIERVAEAYDGWLLSRRGLAAVWRPLLSAVASDDRRAVLGSRLSPEAHQFLRAALRKVSA